MKGLLKILMPIVLAFSLPLIVHGKTAGTSSLEEENAQLMAENKTLRDRLHQVDEDAHRARQDAKSFYEAFVKVAAH